MSKKKAEDLRNDIQLQILQRLLTDEDNKYCVDCDAKSPRWASWNLGIFLCIRCAGIHRKLGVHISRVKSVNLDTWTPEQIAMMKEIGNSRARAIYEAQVPDGFHRPQSDAAVEQLIKAKYEYKRYIAQGFVPPKPDVDLVIKEIHNMEQMLKKKPGAQVSLPLPKDLGSPQQNITRLQRPPSNGSGGGVAKQAPSAAPPQDDLLGIFDNSSTTHNLSESTPVSNTAVQDLFGLNLTSSTQNSAPGAEIATNGAGFANFEHMNDPQAQQKSTKDSILALFDQGPVHQIQQTQQQQVQFGNFMQPQSPGTNFNIFGAAAVTAQTMPVQQNDLDGLFYAPPMMNVPTGLPPAYNSLQFNNNNNNSFSTGLLNMQQQQQQTSGTLPDNFLGDLNLFNKSGSSGFPGRVATPVNSQTVNFANWQSASSQAATTSGFDQFQQAGGGGGQQQAAATGGSQNDYLASIQNKLAAMSVKPSSTGAVM